MIYVLGRGCQLAVVSGVLPEQRNRIIEIGPLNSYRRIRHIDFNIRANFIAVEKSRIIHVFHPGILFITDYAAAGPAVTVKI